MRGCAYAWEPLNIGKACRALPCRRAAGVRLGSNFSDQRARSRSDDVGVALAEFGLGDLGEFNAMIRNVRPRLAEAGWMTLLLYLGGLPRPCLCRVLGAEGCRRGA